MVKFLTLLIRVKLCQLRTVKSFSFIKHIDVFHFVANTFLTCFPKIDTNDANHGTFSVLYPFTIRSFSFSNDLFPREVFAKLLYIPVFFAFFLNQIYFIGVSEMERFNYITLMVQGEGWFSLHFLTLFDTGGPFQPPLRKNVHKSILKWFFWVQKSMTF